MNADICLCTIDLCCLGLYRMLCNAGEGHWHKAEYG